MSWVIFTILAILFRAIYSIATRVLSTGIILSAISQSVLLTGLASIFSLILSPFLGGFNFTHFTSVWIPVIFMIFSSCAGNIVYFKGQEALDAGTTQIAFSSIVIWGALLSLSFLGSHFSFIQVFGILLLLFAIILIQYKKTKLTFSPALLYILTSAFFFAIFQVTSAEVSHALPAGTALPLEYIGTTIVIVILYGKTLVRDFEKIKQNYTNVLQKGLFASGSTLLYYLFAYIAYSLAPDRGIVVLLLTTQVILTVIFGLIFLKEREAVKRKLLAAIIAVAASIMIKA